MENVKWKKCRNEKMENGRILNDKMKKWKHEQLKTNEKYNKESINGDMIKWKIGNINKWLNDKMGKIKKTEYTDKWTKWKPTT